MKIALYFILLLASFKLVAGECVNLSGEYYFSSIAENCSMEKDKPVWFCDVCGCTSFVPESKVIISQHNCEEITISYRDHYFNQDNNTENREKHYRVTGQDSQTHTKVKLSEQSFSYLHGKRKGFALGTEKADVGFKIRPDRDGNLLIEWNNHYKGIGLGNLIIPLIFNSKNSGTCTLDKI
ncbi:MAG: hypothetical protein KAQ98_05960 [Bacteriovoracaceae bacterium]|nr:hypothetical protein [Bacteriovoracaceae bacterium]